MSHKKTIEKVMLELDQIQQLLDTHHQLVDKAQKAVPTVDEIAGLAAVLHAFYSGIENIFKRVAIEIDKKMPDGAYWHSQLIEQMINEASNRPALLTEHLYETLQEYLDFRHVFRQAYCFNLKWDKMCHLVIGIRDVFSNFKNACNFFCEGIR